MPKRTDISKVLIIGSGPSFESARLQPGDALRGVIPSEARDLL